MTCYVAIISDPKTGAEGTYEFQAVDGLLQKSPARVMRVCMNALEGNPPEDKTCQYWVRDARKPNPDVIMIHGELGQGGQGRPFMAVISQTLQ